MARVINTVNYTCDRSGWLAPGLDQGATGNQTWLGPTPYIAGSYTVPTTKKVTIKTLGYSCQKPEVTPAHVAGFQNVGVAGLIRTPSDYLLVFRSHGHGLPASSGAEDQPNFWQSANQLHCAGDGISFTTGETLQFVASPATSSQTEWVLKIRAKLNGTRAFVMSKVSTFSTTASQILWSYTVPAATTLTILSAEIESHIVGGVVGLLQCHHNGSPAVDFGRVGMESGSCEPMDCGSDSASHGGNGGIFLPLWNMTFYEGENFGLGVESWSNDSASKFHQWVFGDDAPLSVCDYPAVGDVESGVTYGSGTYTGTFVVPAEADVKNGTNYGAGGTEFTGTLVGGGGGTQVSGISGDRAQGVSTPVTI